MTNPGPRPVLAWLPVDKLDFDPAYQRTLETKISQKRIQKIADNFLWIGFQAILATPHEDRWLVIDGQHRVTAARRFGELEVPAVVVAEASQAEQAVAFVRANRDRVPMQAQQIFQARLVAGDPDCAIISNACGLAGITIYRHNIAAKQFKPGWTAATPALLASLRKYGETTTRAAISIVADVLGKEPGALRAPIFLAGAMFLHAGGAASELRAGLARLGVERLLENYAIAGGPFVIAAAIVARLRASVAIIPRSEAIVARPSPTAREAAAALSSPVTSPEPAKSPARTGATSMRFQDDPKARRDRGSLDKLPRQEMFGRSPSGSSLA